MNALQQFIQSKLTSAIRKPESTPATTATPQPSFMDRLRGAGRTVQDTLQQANTNRIASSEQPLGPHLRMSGRTLPMPSPITTAPAGRALSGDFSGAGKSIVDNLMGLGVHGAGPQGKPKIRVAPMDRQSIQQLTDLLTKKSQYGFIHPGDVGAAVWRNINPKVDFPPGSQFATFGEMMRGVRKLLKFDEEDILNPELYKGLVDVFNKIHDESKGTPRLPPGMEYLKN